MKHYVKLTTEETLSIRQLAERITAIISPSDIPTLVANIDSIAADNSVTSKIISHFKVIEEEGVIEGDFTEIQPKVINTLERDEV